MSNHPITLNVNGTSREFYGDPDTPLLWMIREQLGLTGTKYGCGIAQCGACTVHVDGMPLRSCSAPVAAMTGRAITTIEGLASRVAKAVQKAWVELDVVSTATANRGRSCPLSRCSRRCPRRAMRTSTMR
jgi:isoquinoline 1-oxidoreductase subunit alpha